MILLTNIVMAECVEPQDGMFVNQDIVFCKGTYHLNKEISITRNNINIDCKKTTITGDKTNIGFLIENSINTTIENCVLMNFIIGISVTFTILGVIILSLFCPKSCCDDTETGR